MLRKLLCTYEKWEEAEEEEEELEECSKNAAIALIVSYIFSRNKISFNGSTMMRKPCTYSQIGVYHYKKKIYAYILKH